MIDVLEKSAKLAGDKLLKYSNKNLKINLKYSHQDFYTQADVESQTVIKNSITELLIDKGIKKTDIGFIGEENLENSVNNEHLFIIDPLDGTVNFASGFNHYAVSIGYFHQGKNVAGIIYNPSNNDSYVAIKGKGAFKNSKKLSISYKPLKSCLVDAFISSRPNITAKLFKAYENIFPRIEGMRNLNCMTLDHGMFTDGIFNVILNGNTYIWDIAACNLLTKESGGEMYDFKGNVVEINLKDPKSPYQIATCHPKLKDELFSCFNY